MAPQHDEYMTRPEFNRWQDQFEKGLVNSFKSVYLHINTKFEAVDKELASQRALKLALWAGIIIQVVAFLLRQLPHSAL